ncbi:MAG: Fic family protein [Verrucomicrobia bacterium]|nr:Fic family protein [Verrucomicrobiota bacterium]
MAALHPLYNITPQIVHELQRIEVVRLEFQSKEVLQAEKTKADHRRMQYFQLLEDTNPIQKELHNYLTARKQLKKWAGEKRAISAHLIQSVHALLSGKKGPSRYRQGQNAVFDAELKHIYYLPPKAEDVPALMNGLVRWVKASNGLACPLVAAVVHFEINSIHPYYDGNGRTARLMTEFILMQGGYDLQGLCCLEEYYAKDLERYYEALSLSKGKNYYTTRAKGDITSWIEYFCEGMALVFETTGAKIRETALPHGGRIGGKKNGVIAYGNGISLI